MARLDTNSRRSSADSSRGGSSRPSRTLDKAQLEKFIALIRSYRGTHAELAKASKLAPSTISMMLSGVRAPSVKVVVRLAKALCPQKRSLDDFTKEMLRLAGYDPIATAYGEVSETILERVRRTGRIRAAYILSDPFVDSNRTGFAVDLFDYVANLIGATITPVDCGIGQLRTVFEDGKADIVVSAVFPTFQRRNDMLFSRPFPYLRVPLSGLVRKGTTIRAGQPLTLDHVLSWTKSTDGLGKIKIMLVEGEVGHDFVGTFLVRVKARDIEFVDTLAPKELYHKISSDPNPNLLFLADMATCVAVHELSRSNGDIEPLLDTSPIAANIQKVLGHKQFPVLALYPITFALPKGEDEWQRTIDRALNYLMTEGSRILLSLYNQYLEREGFVDFCITDDHLVVSRPLQLLFQKLFDMYRKEDEHA